MEFDAYQALGVPSDANDDTIRTAYFRMARAHPPDKEPRVFERIRRAYQTLSNHESRQDYDAMRRFGGEIRETLVQAWLATAEGRNEDAVEAYKHVLDLAPGLNAARDQLAVHLVLMGKYQEAAQMLEILVRRSQDSAMYWHHLGEALSRWARSLPTGTATRQGETVSLFARAREAYLRAIQLEPGNPDSYRGIAWTHLWQLDYAKAVEWFKKAVSADDKVDLFDIEALIEACFAAALGDLDSEFKAAYESITGIISNEPKDIQDYVARLLASHGYETYLVHQYSAARRLLQGAHTIGISDPKARPIIANLITLSGAAGELRKIGANKSISPAVQVIARLRVADALQIPVPDRDRTMEMALAALRKLDRASLQRSIEALRLSYPNIYKVNEDIMGCLQQASNSHQPVNTGSGCLLPILVTLAIAALVLIL